MKRTKRLLSTLLALCMVLAMLPATALAAGNVATTPKNRYTVLVLDCSGSMSGDPMKQQLLAAKKFCATVSAQGTAETVNKVAVVAFATSTPMVVSDFTDNMTDLDSKIDKLTATGGTYIENAIKKADELLVPYMNDNTVTNIMLLTDGYPQHGDESANLLPYTDKDSHYYKVANQCYATAMGIWSRHNLYTLGFFHDLSGKNRAFGQKFLRDISNAGYYEVNKADDLVYQLGEIASGIVTNDPAGTEPFNPATGNKYIKVEIRCPVDVKIRYRTELILDSTDTTKRESPYGVMSVNEADEKTACLRYDDAFLRNYSIEAVGNASAVAGSMMKVSISVVENGIVTEKLIEDQEYALSVGKAYRASIYSIQGIRDAISNEWPVFNDQTGITPDKVDGTNDGIDESHFTFVPTVTGGTVVLSKRNAEPGDWVNIYVTPDEGYELQSITVTDMRGWPVTLREMGENAYSFTMPNARINVNPVFVKTEEPAGDYQYPINVPEVNNSGAPGYGAMVINPGAMNYSDVSAGDWFYDNVKFAHERYLLTGTGEADGKFEPNTAATRASIWVAISRMAGRNTINQGDNWYDRAQVWAKGKGITDGERPMGELTREEFVTMLWRYDGNKYVTNSGLGQFNDGESVSWWATEAVKWAVSSNLLKGDNGNLNPQNNVTRAEVAAVLQRYIQNVR